MTLKELKQKAETGDSVACYELGLSYKGKNYSYMKVLETDIDLL